MGVRAARGPGDACERHGLPLVVLGQETRFAALAQEIGERVVDQQLTELREAQRVHETFTELSFSQAGPVEILQAVQRLAAGRGRVRTPSTGRSTTSPDPTRPAASSTAGRRARAASRWPGGRAGTPATAGW